MPRARPDADAILERMRTDAHHPWVSRLIDAIGRVPRRPSGSAIPDASGEPSLTYCEARALQLLSYGLTVRMAAELLGLSPETVADQVKAARRRLGAKTSTQAVAIAIRLGVIG